MINPMNIRELILPPPQSAPNSVTVPLSTESVANNREVPAPSSQLTELPAQNTYSQSNLLFKYYILIHKASTPYGHTVGFKVTLFKRLQFIRPQKYVVLINKFNRMIYTKIRYSISLLCTVA
jgi:hypothetical protein